jgi:hypothetical protein
VRSRVTVISCLLNGYFRHSDPGFLSRAPLRIFIPHTPLVRYRDISSASPHPDLLFSSLFPPPPPDEGATFVSALHNDPGSLTPAQARYGAPSHFLQWPGRKRLLMGRRSPEGRSSSDFVTQESGGEYRFPSPGRSLLECYAPQFPAALLQARLPHRPAHISGLPVIRP